MSKEEGERLKAEADWAARQLELRGITPERGDEILSRYAADPIGVLAEAVWNDLTERPVIGNGEDTMTSPMPDLPEHCPISVTEHGQGPAFGDDAVMTICWCNDPNCMEFYG